MKLFNLLSAQALAAAPMLGQIASPVAAAERVSLVDHLKFTGLSPERGGTIEIGHYHFDHVGQATDSPRGQAVDRFRSNRCRPSDRPDPRGLGSLARSFPPSFDREI
ncbi:hypothetical protein LJR130_006787 [Variovorax sp. LjRoot130]|uniref:hypothetical protein n=1 Tax=Variovorax sp. LjRoot130 TaxID=3342261 RepID=UPI003ED0642D